MTSTQPATDAWGIQQHWIDADDGEHTVPDEVVAALREVVGEPPEDLEERAPLVVRRGDRLGLGTVEVRLEDGGTRTLEDVVPDDLPYGYHDLTTPGGVERRLIVSPGRCFVPEGQRWGWTVQLYAARSRASWGIGDLADLRTIRTWTEELGGGFVLVNPLHAVPPTLPQEASPYLPATRRFRNPLYLRVDEVAGHEPEDVAEADGLADLRRLAQEAPEVDRDTAWMLKRPLLRRAFERAGGDPELARWREEAGPGLQVFATWCSLAEHYGADWHDWPAELHDHRGPAVAAWQEQHADDVSFHAWLQWQLDRQLREATGDLTVLQDLPIGVSGGGADAWEWQDVLALGVVVGAPPDKLNTTGQDWGSPPLVPWRLRAAAYEPFIASVRATIAGAGGLRIDHVMGLFRLWWIPQGAGATDGAYVRYPSDDLLDIVALESHRAQAVVVGEDLGTVEPAMREDLAARGILSYRVLWFEDDEPEEWPVGALAAVTTHDLPTVAGLWDGSDVEDQLATTTMTPEDVTGGRDELLARLVRDGLPRDASASEAVDAAYRRLGRAPSLLLSIALEDAVGQARRPNMPGTVDRDNWRVPLPRLLDDLVAGTVPADTRLPGLLGPDATPA